MKLFRLILGAALTAGILATAGSSLLSAPDRFPHEKHARLFTNCQTCHADPGAPGGLVTVTAEACARCHDGVTRRKVNWSPPLPSTGNLKFSHPLHVGDMGAACEDCHAATGAATGTAVPEPDSAGAAAAAPAPPAGSMAARMVPMTARPGPDVCLACHAATEHLAAEAECATCHTPLSESPGLSAAQVTGFPRPPNHDDPEFIRSHGTLATSDQVRCAVCHAQQTCETCHLNAAQLAPIAALARDERVAGQAARITPRWPEPADHAAADWAVSHGKAANAGIENCANCHVQSGCTGCHGPTSMAPAIVASLPVAVACPATGATESPGGMVAAGPRGVTLDWATDPPGHGPGFRLNHGAAAAAGDQNCEACHRRDFCADCHNAPATPGFHGPNYIDRHAVESTARDTDCASCHSTEVFCRSCHEDVGLAGNRPKSSSYHDAQPFWLLGHGAAARQGMESCASCHEQNDCLRCHSAKSGWRVNPHGPDFDADRMGDASLENCSQCHFSDPRQP